MQDASDLTGIPLPVSSIPLSSAILFEDPFQDETVYEGIGIQIGGAFTQQFQSLSHENTASEVLKDGKNVNELIEIGNGFNLANANLTLNAQLAEGIRVNLDTYLSSRRHQEAWVKGGYLQIDEAPFLGSELINRVFEHVRLRLGHFEINYGDSHFRRTDNGNAIWNPFVGNYIMDSFTLEIGGEVYVYGGPFFAMGAFTNGENKGSIVAPKDRAPSWYGKVGYDGKVSDDLRLRLTGSAYTTERSLSNTLYSGDRAGSRYHLVMEPVGATPNGNANSGLLIPGFSDHVTAFQVNPFVKYKGLELFGMIERASGGVDADTEDRTFNQYAVEAIYRFLDREQVFVGARYNVVSGELAGSRADVDVSRFQLGAGWFATKNVLLKAEYVNQTYEGFPNTHILNGGQFNGLVIEGVVAF